MRALIVAGVVIAVVLYVVIEADGGYFGPRFVRFAYQRFARWWSYPTTEAARRQDRDELLPLLEARLRGAAGEQRILDVACGTGRVPLLVVLDAPWFRGTIDGLDISSNMLARAQKALDQLDGGRRVTLTEGNATSLQWGDATFDAVTCIEAFHNFGRPRKALREMARVLKPGGVLLVYKPPDRRARRLPFRALTRRQFARVLATQGITTVGFHPYGLLKNDEIMVADKPAP